MVHKTTISSEKLKQIQVIKNITNIDLVYKYILALSKYSKNMDVRSYWSVVLKWIIRGSEK